MSKQRRVLLVDDDREIVRGMSIRLRAAGYTVVTAHNGQDGLNAATDQRPDAIVLDLRMPVMDGLTMLGKLRERDDTAAIPVVVLSANVVEGARTQALDLGARFFLEKPYQPDKLLAAIQASMEEATDATAAAPQVVAGGTAHESEKHHVQDRTHSR